VKSQSLQSDLNSPEWLRATFRLLVYLASRWRSLILRVAILVVVAGAFTALLLPNIYTATVVLLPPQQGSSSGAALLAQLGSLGSLATMGSGGLGIKNPNDLQVSLLKSESVENAMVHRFHLDDQYHKHYLSKARKYWEKETHIDNGLKDGLIRLDVDDRDPRRAAELANGWVEEYKRFSSTLAVTEAQQRRLFFEQELKLAREELTRAEESLKQTEQRTGVIQLDGQAHAMIESAAVLRGQIAVREVEIRGLRTFSTEQNPDLVRAEQELASLEGQLAQMDVNSRGRAGDLVAPKGSVTDAGLDYARGLREVKYRETVYELLMRQYEVARVDEAREGAPVQVVDPANVPDRPSSFYRWWVFLGALLLSVPIAFLCAFSIEVYSALRRGTLLSNWSGVFAGGPAEAAR
jgi:tyrosine-protein kinase Etk/Wzc